MEGAQAQVEHSALKDRLARFVGEASLEIIPGDRKRLAELAELLPAGTEVFVAHIPKAPLEEVVEAAAEAQRAGFRACAHIVARRLEGASQLEKALAGLRAADCDRILLIAGDTDPPVHFTSTLEVLDTGVIEKSGITTVGVAGHPEGHFAVGEDELRSALEFKQAYAKRTGLNLRIVTQFGFNAANIHAWARRLRENGIELPIHVGVAGPTPLTKLIKYAIACGVGASLKALTRNPAALVGMTGIPGLATRPDELMLDLLREADPTSVGIVKPHMFALGGSLNTARWMNAVAQGRFELDENGKRAEVAG